MNILDFETENSYDDVVIAGPGLELGDVAEASGNRLHLTGRTSITTVHSLRPVINITMRTDLTNRKKGFKMTLEAIGPRKYAGLT